MRPVLCLVTDRRREPSLDSLVTRVGAAARAGVHLVQVREPDLDGGPLTELVRRLVDAVAGTEARVIVNDRLDAALAGGAHGLHLPADGPSAARARAYVDRSFLIGRSVHSSAEVERADADGGTDYYVFGTVFTSASKPGRTPAGPELLDAAARATTRPVLAIGGITLERLAKVARTHAAGCAAIGLFANEPPERLAGVVAEATRRFRARGPQ